MEHRRDGVLCRRIACLLIGSVSVGTSAQDFRLSTEPETLKAAKMAVPPKVDGTVSDQEWAGASAAARQLVVVGPNNPSGDKAQFWIGYDDQYLYVAVRTYLQDPKHINADEFRQNASLRGNDSVSIFLDPFGTLQDINVFTFNPAGATNMRLSGGRANKIEWSGQFEAAGRKTDFGWEGETRIAWELMAMPEPGPRDMKILLDWYVSGSQQNVSTHTTNGDFTRIHNLNGVEVPAVDRTHKFHLLPYAYAGIDDDGNHIANAGLDVKTMMGDQLNLIGTVNPDFRNIENDILDLDFSTSVRLANESRPFFLEGREYLKTGDINDRRLFASQRFGSFDAGIKVYGNLSDRMQLGALGMVNHGEDQTVVGSLAYSPDNYTQISGAFVGLDREAEQNKSFDIDLFRRQGNFLMIGQYMYSDDEVDGFGAVKSIGTVYRHNGMEAVALYEDVTPDFNPRAGIAPQTNYRGYAGVLGKEYSYSQGALRDSEFKVTYVNYDAWDGGNYDEILNYDFEATTRGGLGISASAVYEKYLDQNVTLYQMEVELPKNDPYRRWSVSHVAGDVFGEDYESTTLRLLYRPISRLQLDFRHQSVKHFENEEQTIFSANWIMDRYRSLAGRLVREGGEINWFLSYKMSGNTGAEYFLILGDPNATSFQKSLVFKISVPLSVR